MISLRKLLVPTIALAAGLGCGYVAGYFQGYGGGVGHPAIASAYGTTVALKTLREGKTDEAIRQLELTLDTQIVQAAVYKQSSMQLTKAFEGDDTSIAAVVAAYRKSHPSTFPDPEVRRLIDEGLNSRQ